MEELLKKYRLTVGMEVHVELKTATKMFCACPNDPDASRPNANTCPVCMGHPGTLPVPNKKAIESVIKVGLALGCDISARSKFDRKNYFYPDLPKGYQISQYDEPLCRNGQLAIQSMANGKWSSVPVRIHRIHLEEDTGKLIHPAGADHSLVDYNRAGVPLMELVTEADIHDASDAARFCQELQLVLRYMGVSDADMEKGHMRCEANISIAPAGEKKLGTKVEVKNLNSFKAVERAINFEMQRHAAALEAGEKLVQETRGWNDGKGETYAQRSKEDAHDYRYFPEPDIPPLSIVQDEVDGKRNGKNADRLLSMAELRSHLPELPAARRERFLKAFGLALDQVEILTQDRSLGEYFENIASELANEHDHGEFAGLDANRSVNDENSAVGKETTEHFIELYKLAANYLINDLPRALAENGLTSADLIISEENFAEFILRIEKGVISSAGAKVVLAEMIKTGADPDEVIREKNLAQVSDTGELDSVITKIIEANATVVADFKAGKQNALQFLVGQAMKETKGKANPKVVQDLLRRKLS